MSCRTNWSEEEDDLLCELAGELMAKQWSEIEKKFNQKFSGRERTCKQLRQRYKNYLQYEKGSSLVKEWSAEEEKLLFDEYLEKGSKWTSISKKLPGKSEAYIKNKFYGGLRKSLRRINQIRKRQTAKFSKPIKYSSLIRVLEIKEKASTLPGELRDEALGLREKIVLFSQKNLTTDDSEEVLNFCEDLFKFNFSSRCYRAKKQTQKLQLRAGDNSGQLSDISQQVDGEEVEKQKPASEFKAETSSSSGFYKTVQKLYEVAPVQEKLPLAFPRKSSTFILKDSKSQNTDEKQDERPSVNIHHFCFSAFSPFHFQDISGSHHYEQILYLRRQASIEGEDPERGQSCPDEPHNCP